MTELNLIELENTNGGLHTLAKVAAVGAGIAAIATLPATWPGYVGAGVIAYYTGASIID